MQTCNTVPSHTAVMMGIARAVHPLLDEPVVLGERHACHLLDDALREKLIDDPFQFNDPMMRTMRAAVVARSCLVRDALRRETLVAACLSQSVVVGCGLDGFSLNESSRYPWMRFFDVDRPSMQAWRKKALTDSGISQPDNVFAVDCDLNNQALSQSLESAGYDIRLPALYSMMGVTPYLTRERVYSLLEAIARCPSGSSVHFDFRVDNGLLDPIEQMMDRVVERQVAAMGEPWRSSFDPDELEITLKSFGFKDVTLFDTAALNRRYFHRRRDGLQTAGGGLRIISARN